MDDVRCAFPDWQSDSAFQRWPQVKRRFHIGQHVSGNVIALAPFGVWLDIHESWPALILIHNMAMAQDSSTGFNDFPVMGTVIHGRINALGDRGELGLTQLDPDDMIEARTITT